MLVAVMLVAGLVVLTLGAELLVRGASALAGRLGISPLIIGLTIVAFGTSAPEMAVSVKSALMGQADVALGNVVGSNIFNVLFILGISAIIVPLVVQRQLIRIDVPIMIAVSVLLLVLGADGMVSRWEGIALFAGIVCYTVLQIRMGLSSSAEEKAATTRGALTARQVFFDSFMIVVGLVLLVFGARMFVSGAVDVARFFDVSELVIGLTLVAAGTSLPEVAASIMAALRGERDIAVGNVVGSNIFNILAVLGASSAIGPNGVAVASSAIALDIPIMILVAVLCLPIFFTGGRISRLEGALFLALYVVYAVVLVLNSTGHPHADTVIAVMAYGVLPAVGIYIAGLSLRQWRQHKRTGIAEQTS